MPTSYSVLLAKTGRHNEGREGLSSEERRAQDYSALAEYCCSRSVTNSPVRREMGPKLPGLRRSAINVGATWLLQAGTLLFALVSVPLVTRRFGLEGLGVWLLVQQLASHFQLLELGLASSLGRFLSRDHAQRNGAAYSEHSTSAIVLLLGMGLVLVLLAYPIGQVFPRFFIAPDSASEGAWMLTIALVLTGMTLPLRSAIGVLASQHQFALQAGVDGIALLLRVTLVIAACTMVEDHALIALSWRYSVLHFWRGWLCFSAPVGPLHIRCFRAD